MLRRGWEGWLLREDLRCCLAEKNSRACSVEKNVSNCSLGRILRGCHVRILRLFVLRRFRDLESEGLHCEMDSDGFLVEKNLGAAGVKDSEGCCV